MKIIWRRAALSDLAEIAEYIARDNPQAARRVVTIIRKEVVKLKRNPLLGRMGRVEDTRELVITHYPYIVAYQVQARTVEILAVVHTARLWPLGF